MYELQQRLSSAKDLDVVLKKEPFLFTVVRHPYERIVSYFYDCLENPVCPAKISADNFNGFLTDYVVDSSVLKDERQHWIPMNQICAFCSLPYTAISYMETFSEDHDRIVARLVGNTSVVSHHNNHTGEAIQDIATRLFDKV